MRRSTTDLVLIIQVHICITTNVYIMFIKNHSFVRTLHLRFSWNFNNNNWKKFNYWLPSTFPSKKPTGSKELINHISKTNCINKNNSIVFVTACWKQQDAWYHDQYSKQKMSQKRAKLIIELSKHHLKDNISNIIKIIWHTVCSSWVCILYFIPIIWS